LVARECSSGSSTGSSTTGTVEICEVWAVGARADAQVYAQAVARLRDAQGRRPEVHRLAEVVERLGWLSDAISVAEPVTREPLPDWLATRLVHTAGSPPEEVAAMDLQEAVDRWAEFMSKSR
jgi:mRNA interferase RelE/StbE